MSPLLTVNAPVQCPHGAPAAIVPSNTRVLAGGAPVALLSDTTLVTGCPFNVSGVPQPCVPVTWIVGATRVLVGGQPALVLSATGLAQSAAQVPAGPPVVSPAQTRAMGS